MLVVFPAYFVIRIHFSPAGTVNEAPPSALMEAELEAIPSSFVESFFLPYYGQDYDQDYVREAYDSPVEAYYAGRIEEAMRLLSVPGMGLAQKYQLVVLHWELGENAEAANLLEELLRDPRLTLAQRDELQLELFITRVLSGSYAQAASLRNAMEPALQRMNRRRRAEIYFYIGWVYHETGDLENAEEFFRQSLEIYEWRALAWYRLGTILLGRDSDGDSDSEEGEETWGAEEAFQTAWNKDGALTPALLPLARLLADRGEWMRSRNLLITANERRPDDPEIREALADALRRIGPPGDGLQFVRRHITDAPPRVTPAPITPGEGIMRIGLAENRQLVSVKAGGDFTIRNAETGEVLYNGEALRQFWVAWDREQSLFIHDRENRVLLTSSVPVVYELHSPEDTSIVSGVVTWAMSINRTYRGKLEFRPGPEGITVVSIVNMGDYLYGVIPAELPTSWPREIQYAQAIAARSYAIAYRGTFAYRGFDIWNTARSQTYMGVGIENANSSSAVDATRGIILVGETGEPLAAYYSANHGGHSEDSLVMWGYEMYMQAVQDPQLPPRSSPLPPDALFRWIRDAPATYSNVFGFFFPNTYRWERWVSPEEIRRRLILDNRVGQDPGEIHRIITRGRGISGRVIELEVQGSEGSVHVRGNPIWFTMGGLRSSLFTIRYKMAADGGIQYFVFQGAGYGHGIGMDQHAAAAMASAGMTAVEILHHFYPRAALRQLDPSLQEY
ncbi:MAG: SpoIID/LytB domain-containing protein [Treponema sp.]|nr:SpoIID/LytB domain-containing protein [Treponema sp.]